MYFLGDSLVKEKANARMMMIMMMMLSKFNGTSTPKGSYSAKAGVNCPMSLKQSPLEKNVMVLQSKHCVLSRGVYCLEIIDYDLSNGELYFAERWMLPESFWRHGENNF